MRTIWLASYPKSGNTWLRMLIGALSLKQGEVLDINDLPVRWSIASARMPFENLTLIDSGLLTHDEIDALRPSVHAAMHRGDRDEDATPADAVRFVKTHDAYTYLPDGTPMLAGRAGADGAVLIVRDPRDVASSFANHSNMEIDHSVARMSDAGHSFCGRVDMQDSQLRQRLLGWSGFNASWLDQHDLPVILVRYEDMIADAAAVLTRVMAFAESSPQPDEIGRAVALADFAKLKGQEASTGFREAPLAMTEGRFFRRGKAGAWREELNETQIRTIERAHGAMMRRMGYVCALARTLRGAEKSQHDDHTQG